MAYTTIKKPSDYFNTNLYTGNNTETSHTVGFQPDFTWLKVRNAAGSHYLFDSVRLATKYLQANSTGTEGTDANTLKSFDANGYTVGTSNSINTNGETMVGWNWLANGTGVANTDGSISSTVSANTTAGFSIVSYTGNGSGSATVGHGLGVIPSMVIIKARTAGSANGFWYVKHKSLSSNYNINLNSDSASSDVTSVSQGGIGDLDNVNTFDFASGTSGITTVNASGTDFIAYCFAEKQGYSKFGSYTGNGNADGSFIYTGFKPAVFIVKKTNGIANWEIRDNKRTNSFNTQDERLFPNLSNAGSSSEGIDFISNGLKLRGTSSNWNDAGGTYSYMAFAEEPLVGDNPATAR
jgi:hypothetical protein